jgi:hypothetical protein
MATTTPYVKVSDQELPSLDLAGGKVIVIRFCPDGSIQMAHLDIEQIDVPAALRVAADALESALVASLANGPRVKH